MVVRNRADGTVDSVSSTANAVKVTMSHPTAGGDPRAIDVVLWDTRF
jgi:hypothetical protein